MHPGGCVDSSCTPKELHLNASALSDPDSLIPFVSILVYNLPSVSTLVNSSSTHCFIDSDFAAKHSIPLWSIPPIPLCFLDGRCVTYIMQVTDLTIWFSTGNITSDSYYVTSLDSSCSLVLGHSWLRWHNPLIDWFESSITFHSSVQSLPAPLGPRPPASSSKLVVPPPILLSPPTTSVVPPSSPGTAPPSP